MPYDHQKYIFYQEQWIYAEYIDEDNGAVVYYVRCPTAWSQGEKNRAENHFNSLDLANRYSLEAGKHLSEVIDQKNAFVDVILGFNPQATTQAIKDAFVNANLQPIINSGQFSNHWKKVMYQCLANSATFFQV